MNKKTVWIGAAALGAVVVIGGAAVLITDPFDNDRLSGSTLEQASAAALAEVGSGTVREAETSDDLDHSYIVDVRLSDGSDADVALDKNFDVVWVDLDNVNRADDNQDGDDRAATSNTGDSGQQSSPSSSTAPSDAAASTTVDPEDVPLTDAEVASTSEAAIAAAGGTGGTVTDIDRSDDADHAFEVEVTFADGTDVDVELDSTYNVVRIDDDSLTANR
ncbi:MAG: hypothetical protein JWQ43_1041 [Glaciihabitans sp.]|nr:hypothetical protein [Glaciihabitans sp.]